MYPSPCYVCLILIFLLGARRKRPNAGAAAAPAGDAGPAERDPRRAGDGKRRPRVREGGKQRGGQAQGGDQEKRLPYSPPHPGFGLCCAGGGASLMIVFRGVRTMDTLLVSFG